MLSVLCFMALSLLNGFAQTNTPKAATAPSTTKQTQELSVQEIPAPTTVIPQTLAAELAAEPLFTQAMTVFKFGTYGEQTQMLETLLKHYKIKQAQLPATEQTPAGTSPLYQHYYKPLIEPLFQNNTHPALTPKLLAWIESVPLPQQIDFITALLEQPETKQNSTPVSTRNKTAALNTLTALDLPSEVSTPLLLPYLKDPQVHLDRHALMTAAAAGLSGKGTREVVKILKQSFNIATKLELKLTLMRSIAQFKALADLPFFTQQLDNHNANEDIHWTALAELRHYAPHPEVETLLLQYAAHDDVRWAARALYSLGSFFTPAVYQTLITATKHNDPFIREQALTALSKQPQQSDTLNELMRYKRDFDSDAAVRQTAQKILDQYEAQVPATVTHHFKLARHVACAIISMVSTI